MKKVFNKKGVRKSKRDGIRITGKTAIYLKGYENQNVTDRENLVSVCLPCVYTALILIGNLYGFCKTLEMTWEKQWVYSIMLIAVVSTAFVKLSQKYRKVFFIGIGIMIAMGVMSWSHMQLGFEKLANLIIRAWNDYYGTKAGLFEVSFFTKVDYPVLYVVFVLALLLSYMLNKRSGKIGIILISLSVTILGLMIGTGPDRMSMILILCGVLPAMSYLEKRTIEENGMRIKNGIIGSAFAAILLVLSLFLANILPDKWESSVLGNHNKLLAYQISLEQQIMSIDVSILDKIFSFGAQESGYISNKFIRYTGKEIFTVTLTGAPQEKMYFRGYVGSIYRNGKWFEPDDEAFETEAEKWGVNEYNAGIQIMNQSYQNGLLSMGTQTVPGIRLDYGEDCEGYSYLPSFFPIDSSKGKGYGLSSLADAEINKPTHVDKYVQSEQSILQGYISFDIESESGTVYSVTDIDGMYSYVGTVEEYLSEDAMAQYEAYVKREYTKTTSLGLERLSRLAKQWKKEGYGAVEGDVNYAIPITKVLEELHSRTDYNRKPGFIPMGSDAVENFLFDSKKGYCIHYASAATILLQKLGVPARYVSGYAVTADEFVKNEDGTYTAVVPDNDGHAWVEVYDPQMGWIPIEATKGSISMEYGSDAAALQYAQVVRQENQLLERQNSEQSQEPEIEQTEKPSETEKLPEATETENSSPDTAGTGNTNKNGVVGNLFLEYWQIIIFVLFLLLVSLFGGRRIYRYYKRMKRSRRLNHWDTRVVVREASYAISEQLIKSGMLKEKNLSDEIYTIKASGKMDFLGDDEFEKFMECAKKCAFTDYVPTKKEAAWARHIYEKLCIAIHNQNV